MVSLLMNALEADVTVDDAVACQGRRIKLPMFVDTGGQTVCLNRTSWKALAPHVNVTGWGERKSMFGTVHGVPDTEIHYGQGRTAGVNMVGCQWLSQAKLILVADYVRRGCVLVKSDESSRMSLPMLPDLS